MSVELDQTVQEWLTWYKEHEYYFKRIEYSKDPEKVNEFMLTSMRGIMLALAICARDIREIENAKSSIMLPTGMRITR